MFFPLLFWSIFWGEKKKKTSLNLLQLIFSFCNSAKFHTKKMLIVRKETHKNQENVIYIYINQKPWFVRTNLWEFSLKTNGSNFMRIANLENHLIGFFFKFENWGGS
jgi:hypothetical protein